MERVNLSKLFSGIFVFAGVFAVLFALMRLGFEADTRKMIFDDDVLLFSGFYEDKNKFETNNNDSSELKSFFSFEEFVSKNIREWEGNKTGLEKNNFKFNYLRFEKLNEEGVLTSDLSAHYEKLKSLEKMQKMALHISSKYEVPLLLSEEIVFNSFLFAKKEKVEPLLVLSLIGVESTFRPQSKSSVGAIGLTQVIPKYHVEKIADLPNQDFLWTIRGNISVGVKVLKEYLVRSKGDVQRALQMYNGSLDDDELRYSKKVLTKFDSFKKIVERDI